MDAGSEKDGRGERLGRLAAIVAAVLVALLILRELVGEGLPWDWLEICLAGLILIVAGVAIGLYVGQHRSQEGRPPLLGRHGRLIAVILVLAAASAVIGFAVGSERAARGDPTVRADAASARELGRVMRKLRARSQEFANNASQEPVLYASQADKLGRFFERGAMALERVHRRIDLGPLILVLGQLGMAYDRLGDAALELVPHPARFEAAQQKLRQLGARLRRIETELGEAGLPLRLPPLGGI